ncbi:MAG: dienelactone hydrolase [Pirellulaceae bacterium]|nr:dienelactone hydrolase [Pirellulaceae bacterium]
MTLIVFLSAALLLPIAQTEVYDPLLVDEQVTIVDAQFSYGDDNRIVPMRLYLPKSTEATPVILYSHGLGGSRDAGTFLGKHWAGRGYVVVTMQHAGSDQSVMEGIPLRQKLDALKKAANATSAQARYRDVKATLDHLDSLNRPGGKYAARFDLTKIGMGGHSFGAVTTQAVSGQSFGRRGQQHTDKRIDAAVALSPSPPSFGSASDAFGSVSIPWLLMTGTEDASMLARTTPEKRREVFQHLPQSGQFYELLLDGAKHEAFADERTNRFRSRLSRNPNHHKAIKAISTAFWDTYLKDDDNAKAWLNSNDAKDVLEPADVWQKK